MRISIRIDSATEAEMRALQQAYHATMKDVDAPGLYEKGTMIYVMVNGPKAYTAETPQIPRPHVKEMLLNLLEHLDARVHPALEERSEEPMGADGLRLLSRDIAAAIDASVSDDWLEIGEADDIVYDVLHRHLGGG